MGRHRGVAVAFLLACLFANPDTALADTKYGVALVITRDPLSCAGAQADFVGSPFCTYDLGTYQIARTALAVETFAATLKRSGVNSPQTDIEREVWKDVARFGVTSALTAPAMALADISSLRGSPFGSDSKQIRAGSLLTIEYLAPGTLSGLSLDMNMTLHEAGVKPLYGPTDFENYLKNFASKSVGLEDMRLFTPIGNKSTVISKIKVLPNLLDRGVPPNAASDFRFVPALQVVTRSPIPLATAFVSVANAAVLRGDRLFGNIPTTSSGLTEMEKAPFGCASCVITGPLPNAVPQLSQVALFSVPPSAEFAQQLFPNAEGFQVGLKEGRELLTSERRARISMASGGAQMSDARRAGNSPNASISIQDEACNATCYALGAAKTAGAWAADALKLGADIVKDRDGDQFARDFDIAVDKVPERLVEGVKLWNRCKAAYCGEVAEKVSSLNPEKTKEVLPPKRGDKPEPDPKPEDEDEDEDDKPKPNPKPKDEDDKPKPNPKPEDKSNARQSVSETEGARKIEQDQPGPRSAPPECIGRGREGCGCPVNAAGEIGVCSPLDQAEVRLSTPGKRASLAFFSLDAQTNVSLTVRWVTSPPNQPLRFESYRHPNDAGPAYSRILGDHSANSRGLPAKEPKVLPSDRMPVIK